MLERDYSSNINNDNSCSTCNTWINWSMHSYTHNNICYWYKKDNQREKGVISYNVNGTKDLEINNNQEDDTR